MAASDFFFPSPRGGGGKKNLLSKFTSTKVPKTLLGPPVAFHYTKVRVASRRTFCLFRPPNNFACWDSRASHLEILFKKAASNGLISSSRPFSNHFRSDRVLGIALLAIKRRQSVRRSVFFDIRKRSFVWAGVAPTTRVAVPPSSLPKRANEFWQRPNMIERRAFIPGPNNPCFFFCHRTKESDTFTKEWPYELISI